MEGTTIAAIITASGAIIVGGLKLLKPKPKEGVTPMVGSVSDSMVAVGTNINQSSIVHHHHAEPPQSVDPFYGKVESKPSIVEIMEDLAQERKPYEANQRYKHYAGLPVCWPVTVYGVWENPLEDTWTIRLESEAGDRNGVIVEIDIKKYPKLKVVARGHRAWVEGTIRKVDSDVYLAKGAMITLE